MGVRRVSFPSPPPPPNCSDRVKIELETRDPFAWTPPDPTPDCIDEGRAHGPRFAPSCPAMPTKDRCWCAPACCSSRCFPGAALGKQMKIRNEKATYGLVSTAAFVNEPMVAHAGARGTTETCTAPAPARRCRATSAAFAREGPRRSSPSRPSRCCRCCCGRSLRPMRSSTATGKFEQRELTRGVSRWHDCAFPRTTGRYQRRAFYMRTRPTACWRFPRRRANTR